MEVDLRIKKSNSGKILRSVLALSPIFCMMKRADAKSSAFVFQNSLKRALIFSIIKKIIG